VKSSARIIMVAAFVMGLVAMGLGSQPFAAGGVGPDFSNQPEAAQPTAKVVDSGPDEMELVYSYEQPQVVTEEGLSRVEIAGMLQEAEPGEPLLPTYYARILLPAGKTVDKTAVQEVGVVEIEGEYMLAHGQRPFPLSRPDLVTATPRNEAIYGSDDLFTAEPGAGMSTQVKHGYAILLVRLNPVRYRPKSGKLFFSTAMRVKIVLKDGAEQLGVGAVTRPQDAPDVRNFVDNPSEMDSYEEAAALRAAPSALPPGSYEHVIITSAALEGSSLSPKFQDLRDARIAGGMTSTIVTVEYIYANYAGTRPDGGSDNQTRIRNFIADAYSTWGTRYVLLGGDADGADVGGESGDDIVPCRTMYAMAYDGDQGDYIPADLYYGCLDGTFDNSANGVYGQPNDGPGGGEVDLLAEVYVGRACVDSEQEVANFVAKTLAYESGGSVYLRRARMVGQEMDHYGGGDWAGNRKDQIKQGSSANGYTTVGFEDSPYADVFEVDTLYERDGSWTATNISNIINNGVNAVNHMGHGNNDWVMKLTGSAVGSLTNTEYFVGYSQACYSGSFDNWYFGGYYLNIDAVIEHLSTEAHGCAAFVGNSRYGWYSPWSTNGPGQRFDRQFWDAVFGEDIFELGRMNQDSKEDNSGYVSSSSYGRWCCYALTLFGDPALEFRSPVFANVLSPNGGETFYVGVPYVIAWDMPVEVTDVEIEYSTNGGSGWSTIVASTPNDGSYSWIVPNDVSNDCLVRISDAADGDPSDESDAPFSISVATAAFTASFDQSSPQLNNGLWTTIPFNLPSTGYTLIEIEGLAQNGDQNGTGDDDNLRVVIDATDYGWDSANAFDGSALAGMGKTILITTTLAAGPHTLQIWVDETPYVQEVRVTPVPHFAGEFVYAMDAEPVRRQASVWRKFYFSLPSSGIVQIEVRARADDAGQNGTGDDDNLKVVVDSTDYGWEGNNAIRGDLLHSNFKTISVSQNMSAGLHKIELWADETPYVDEVRVLSGTLPIDRTYDETSEQVDGLLLWKEIYFQVGTAGYHLVEIEGSADNGAQNGTGNDDDLKIVLDSTDYGWNNTYALDGAALNGMGKTIVIPVLLSSGGHSVKLWVNQTPYVYQVRVRRIPVATALPFTFTVSDSSVRRELSLWRKIYFWTPSGSEGDVRIEIGGYADSGAENGTGDDDNLKIVVDATDYGWNGPYSLKGSDPLRKSGPIVIEKYLSSGWHKIELWADETPYVSDIQVQAVLTLSVPADALGTTAEEGLSVTATGTTQKKVYGSVGGVASAASAVTAQETHAPTLAECWPAQGAVNARPDAAVIVDVCDADGDIDLASVRLAVDGTVGRHGGL